MNEEGCRSDGRCVDEIRPMCQNFSSDFMAIFFFEMTRSGIALDIKEGVVSRANGSAYLEMRHTKVICAV